MYRRPVAPPGQYQDLTQTSQGVYGDPRPDHPPLATGALMALIVLAYVADWMVPGLKDAWAVRPEALLGEPWRLVTGAFMHADPIHLAANAYFGWYIGSRVERVIGAARLLVISAVAMVGSGVAVAISHQSAVGFSGVLFGWFASWLAFHLTPRFPALHLSGPQRAAYIQNLVLNVLISLVPGISFQAHLGGFVSGFVVAYLLGLGSAAARRPAGA
jgi:membrane associated rhomboid family serine protease